MFWHLRFEERLPARSHESPSASHTLGQAATDLVGWGEACNFMFSMLVHNTFYLSLEQVLDGCGE
jgi:hypothetical protein